MAHQATEAEITAVVDRVHEIGLKTELSRGEERTQDTATIHWKCRQQIEKDQDNVDYE